MTRERKLTEKEKLKWVIKRLAICIVGLICGVLSLIFGMNKFFELSLDDLKIFFGFFIFTIVGVSSYFWNKEFDRRIA